MSNNSKASFSSESYFLEKKWMWSSAAATWQDTPVAIHQCTQGSLCRIQKEGEHSWGIGLRAFSSTSLPSMGSRVCLLGTFLQLGEVPHSRVGQRILCDTSAPILIPIQCGHRCQLSALQLPGGPHWTGLAAASDWLSALLGTTRTPTGGSAADLQPPKSSQGPCSSSGLF